MHMYKYFIVLFYKYFKRIKQVGPMSSANLSLSLKNRSSLGLDVLRSLQQELFKVHFIWYSKTIMKSAVYSGFLYRKSISQFMQLR